MTSARKHKKATDYDVKKELEKVDRIFRSIENDKSLPTFGNFFVECLLMGIAENVNLKIMYPKVYKKLDTFLKEHQAKILALRK